MNQTYYKNKKLIDDTTYELKKLNEMLNEPYAKDNPTIIFLREKLKKLFSLYGIKNEN